MSTGYTKPKRHELQEDLKMIAELPDRITEFKQVRLKEILNYINQEKQNRLKMIDHLLIHNPGSTFEHWARNIYSVFNLNELNSLKDFIINHLKDPNRKLNNDFKPFRERKRYEQFRKYFDERVNVVGKNEYQEISAIFQMILKCDLIEPIGQKQFMKWLLDKELIDENLHGELDITGQFVSAKKSCKPEIRRKSFKQIFELENIDLELILGLKK